MDKKWWFVFVMVVIVGVLIYFNSEDVRLGPKEKKDIYGKREIKKSEESLEEIFKSGNEKQQNFYTEKVFGGRIR